MDLKELKDGMGKDLRHRFGKDVKTWVWPEFDGVKGFYGTGEINNAIVVWITERPALPKNEKRSDKFPDWIDKAFYQILKEEGFENLHFTDFVKIMEAPGKQPSEAELKASAEWMKKELETVSAKGKKPIIIANSLLVKKWMDEYLPEYGAKYVEFFKKTLRFGKRNVLRQVLRNIYKETKECEMYN